MLCIHVKGVKRSSKYTVRAVMLCMLKVLKETQNTLYRLYAMYVNVMFGQHCPGLQGTH